MVTRGNAGNYIVQNEDGSWSPLAGRPDVIAELICEVARDSGYPIAFNLRGKWRMVNSDTRPQEFASWYQDVLDQRI